MDIHTKPTAHTVSTRLEPAEVDWEITSGQRVSGYGYNRQIPGPYHPHTNETVQMEKGLCGALVVHGPGRARS